MMYIYAALLLHSASKPIDVDNIKKILTAAEVAVDEARVKALTAALSEVKIDDVLKQASSAAFAPAAPAAPTAPSAAPSAEAKKTEEKKEEEALAGLGALFG
ncbi:MAG: 50S ribosomal protein P1 [Candidatus Bathyarchaeota archaeon]|nr:50S ribosomal protein P1 [Candidatus Bathyarchaeota archaeon]